MRKNKQRFHRRVRRWAVVALVFIVCTVAAVGYGTLRFSEESPSGDDHRALAADTKKRINFLLLGSDARDGEMQARSDSIIFVSADPKNKRLVLLSIPRDTLVDIPGHGRDRINAAMLYGGPELTMRVVEELIGQTVDYYVVTNYEGFIKLVDTLGGVTIEVDKNMYHYDPEKGGRFSINLRKGKQRLDGEKALMYVRYRNDVYGDINRVERQQKFLRAVVEEMLRPRNLVRLPLLIPKIKDCIYTNLSLDQMLLLARMARDMDDVETISGTLPGYFAGDPYWHVNPDEAKLAVARLLDGQPITQVIEETPAGVVVKQEPETPAVTDVYASETVSGESYGSVVGESYGTVIEESYAPGLSGDIGVEIVPGAPSGGDEGFFEGPSAGAEENPPGTQPGTAPAGEPSADGTAGAVYDTVYTSG
ncbi:MAG: LCP family protein [Bacillota bacterium]